MMRARAALRSVGLLATLGHSQFRTLTAPPAEPMATEKRRIRAGASQSQQKHARISHTHCVNRIYTQFTTRRACTCSSRKHEHTSSHTCGFCTHLPPAADAKSNTYEATQRTWLYSPRIRHRNVRPPTPRRARAHFVFVWRFVRVGVGATRAHEQCIAAAARSEF